MRRKGRRRHAEPPRCGATGRKRSPIQQRTCTKIARSAAARSHPLAEGLQERSDSAERGGRRRSPIQHRTRTKIARSAAARSRPLAEGLQGRSDGAAPRAESAHLFNSGPARKSRAVQRTESAPIQQRTCSKIARSAAGRSLPQRRPAVLANMRTLRRLRPAHQNRALTQQSAAVSPFAGERQSTIGDRRSAIGEPFTKRGDAAERSYSRVRR